MGPSASNPVRPDRVRLVPSRARLLAFAMTLAALTLARALAALSLPPVAVLCLHGFGDAPEDPWTLPAARLEEILAAVEASGRRPISLARFLDHVGPRPEPAVLLSFDDARASHAGRVRRALEARGWPAVFFVQAAPRARELSDGELRDLARRGHSLGSHSMHHGRFRRLPGESPEDWAARLRLEVAGSRARLEALLELPVRAFSFPSGEHPPEAVAAVRRAGYEVAFTTEYGHVGDGADRWRLPRFMPDRTTPPGRVAEYLTAPEREARWQVAVSLCVLVVCVLLGCRARRD